MVSDEETSAIIDAVEAYDALPDPGWLEQSLSGRPLMERLNTAMSWVQSARLDSATQLIKRGNRTDWGDIKRESDGDPSHMGPGDEWTVSIYDQAIAYAALEGLARLNSAVGREQDRAHWESEAANLRVATNFVLWQDDPDHGFYRIHQHIPLAGASLTTSEDNVIAIGNAAAIYYGLADADKVPRILGALERARVAAGANNWNQAEMGPGSYQNGAIWDWWGGRQASDPTDGAIVIDETLRCC